MAITNRYLQPHANQLAPLRRAINNAGAPQSGNGVVLLGVEVVQSIQDVDNSVRLIAGKATIVRLYLDWPSVAVSTLLTAELAWRRGGGGTNYLPAMNRIEVRADSAPTLTDQRMDLALSLNFLLPPDALDAGLLELTIVRIAVPGGENLPVTNLERRVLKFHSAPVLRVRAIGLRYKSYRNPDTFISPDALHFAYLKSYLERAYPVARVEWSQHVVDADLITPPFPEHASDLVNAQLAAIRAREIPNGVDPRTHYYGLVDNEGGTRECFMRGSAAYDATSQSFGLIACGPAGVPHGWSGDTDASFADWYGAHELGHTFQRRHPGFPKGKNGQRRDELEQGFPYPDGLITTRPGNRYVGFDVGNPAIMASMRVLPGELHHDVMTYAERQWLSAYTYEAIFDQLLEEDVRLAPSN